MHGYTVSLVRVNRAAPSHMLGVKLGRACIKAGVSVAQVAAILMSHELQYMHGFVDGVVLTGA